MKKIVQRVLELPLYARLTLFVGIILICIFSILLLTAQYFYIHVVNQQFELRAKTIANNLAEVTIPPLLNYDEMSLGQNCSSIAQQKDVLYVAILNTKGRVLGQAAQISQEKLSANLKRAFQNLDDPADALVKCTYLDNRSVLEVFRTIQIQDVVWGYILIGIDLSEFNKLISRARWISLALGLFFILLAIYSVQKITERVVSPVKYLIRGTEEVSAGNFNFKIEMKDRSEFGQLALKFNEMTAKLNYYYKQKELLHRKLHEYSEGLEQNVRERTRQLQQIQKEVLQIFHQIPIGLLTVNKEGLIRWYNEELLKILEIKNKKTFNNANIYLNSPFGQEAFQQKIKEALEQKKRTVFQFSYNLSDDERRILDIYAQPITSDSEGHAGMIFILKDITQETALKKQINRAQRLESMGILAGGIAHDFNNALGIILPNAQMLKLKLKDQNLLHYVETIERATDQAASLTKQVLSFSRGHQKGKSDVFNLSSLINEFLAMFTRVVSRKVMIKTELDDNLWNIEADKTQIEQILMNLSMNSVDAMPKGGELIYRTTNIELSHDRGVVYPDMKKGKYVKFEIIDNGTGIPPQFLDKIFDPFFSSKEEGQGTGLGLSIVYGLVQAYGGIIDVQSKIDRGTQFSIFLPATTKKETSKATDTYRMPTGKGKIMLVDDEAMLRDTVSHMLESMKYKVIIVQDGKQAVGTYNKNADDIDLIIMDIQMPEMDGIEAADLIWKKNPKAKIIFSSGYADPAKLEELRRKGVKELLRKPYRMDDLVDIIQKTMNSQNHS